MQDFIYDIRAITEVSMPGYAIADYAYADNLGFGKYNIIYTRRNLFTKDSNTINAKLNRNVRIGSFNDFYTNRNLCAFTELWNNEEGSKEYKEAVRLQKEHTKTQITHISELPSTSYIAAWVRFTDDLTMQELSGLKNTYSNIDFKWIAVRTAHKQGQQLMGFTTDDGFSMSDMVSQAKYPGFQLADLMYTADNVDYDVQQAKNYEIHYTSLLKYLVDHHKAVTALVGKAKAFDYKSALDYVKNNGISTYGALIYGEADDLLELYDAGKIMTLTINNVIASKYIQ